MKNLKALVLLSATVCLAAGGAKRASDFPNRVEAGGLALGARLLAEDEVKNRFFSDVYRKYLVVEVAIEPSGGAKATADRKQFSLRAAGLEQPVGAATPAHAAKTLREAAQASKSVKVAPRASIGYRTGDTRPPHERNDPLAEPPFDRRRGAYTRTGVDVTWGEPAAGSSPADQSVMETELADKEVPLGQIRGPVAGFLYFPKPEEKATGLKLEFQAPSGAVTLEL